MLFYFDVVDFFFDEAKQIDISQNRKNKRRFNCQQEREGKKKNKGG